MFIPLVTLYLELGDSLKLSKEHMNSVDVMSLINDFNTSDSEHGYPFMDYLGGTFSAVEKFEAVRTNCLNFSKAELFLQLKLPCKGQVLKIRAAREYISKQSLSQAESTMQTIDLFCLFFLNLNNFPTNPFMGLCAEVPTSR